MNIFLRILLAIYAFCLTVLSFVVMLITFRHDILDTVYDYFNNQVLSSTANSVIMFFVALIFFGLSFTFLLSGVRSNKDKKAVSKYTNIGEIKISLDSIENIALAASRKLIGVRETKAYVTRYADSVAVFIRAVVLPDINIPALSEDIQVKVKSSIEESAGIKVSEVRVMVENIHTGYKSRVE